MHRLGYVSWATLLSPLFCQLPTGCRRCCSMTYLHFFLSLVIVVTSSILTFLSFKYSLILTIHLLRGLPLPQTPSTSVCRVISGNLFVSTLSKWPNQIILLCFQWELSVSVAHRKILICAKGLLAKHYQMHVCNLWSYCRESVFFKKKFQKTAGLQRQNGAIFTKTWSIVLLLNYHPINCLLMMFKNEYFKFFAVKPKNIIPYERMQNLHFETTQTNKVLLICPDGFSYIKHKAAIDVGTEYWRCEQRKTCKGRGISSNNRIHFRLSQGHSHLPDPLRREMRNIKTNMKQIAVNAINDRSSSGFDACVSCSKSHISENGPFKAEYPKDRK